MNKPNRLCVLMFGWLGRRHLFVLICTLVVVQSIAVPRKVMAEGGVVPAASVHQKAAPIAVRDTAAAKLLGQVLDGYIPLVLHEEKNVAWMGGVRAIKVTKAGKAVLTSDAKSVTIIFPLHANMAANINTQIAIVQINAACQAQFTTPAKVTLNIDFTKTPLQVEALIDVVVPPTSANCEGYQISVQALMQSVIDQQKHKWQNDIQQQITSSLRTVGI